MGSDTARGVSTGTGASAVRRLRTVGALLAIALVATLSLGMPGARAADNPWRATDEATAERFEVRVLELVNRHRAAHDRKPLARQVCVDRHATRWANRLVTEDRWAHSKLARLLDRCEASYAAENLATWKRGTTPREVVRAWMRSDGHRRNILSGKARVAGVSVRWDDNRRAFYAVLDFARIP